jgi:hypothetical protein
MLQSVEKNERRTKLKKYRGILLARISNNVLLHDHLTVGTHNPGEHRGHMHSLSGVFKG